MHLVGYLYEDYHDAQSLEHKNLYQHGSKSHLLYNCDQSLRSIHTSVTCAHLQLGQYKMFGHQKQKVVLCLAVHEKKCHVVSDDK